LYPIKGSWVLSRIAEESEEGGGEEGVDEFECIAAGAALPVRLVQKRCVPLLFGQIGERNALLVGVVTIGLRPGTAADLFRRVRSSFSSM